MCKFMIPMSTLSKSYEFACWDSPTVKSRLRLQAAWSLVQLATVPAYADTIHKNFIAIALTCQVRTHRYIVPNVY